MQAIELEIDGQYNECLHFRPIQRAVRGRFDMQRIGEPMARVKAQEWAMPIPSQRLGINPDGIGYISEPLHDAEYAPLKEKIEKQGMRLEPKLQTFEGIHLPSWLYWLKQAVASGLARVVKGKLPDVIDGEPRKNFILAAPEQSTADKLTNALTEQTAAFNRLSDALLKVLESK